MIFIHSKFLKNPFITFQDTFTMDRKTDRQTDTGKHTGNKTVSFNFVGGGNDMHRNKYYIQYYLCWQYYLSIIFLQPIFCPGAEWMFKDKGICLCLSFILSFLLRKDKINQQIKCKTRYNSISYVYYQSWPFSRDE